jgi:DNA-binding NarL/FixJ family response regulator
VIVDLSLPGANGIELIKNIRAEYPKLPILVLSMHDESLYALRAMGPEPTAT